MARVLVLLLLFLLLTLSLGQQRLTSANNRLQTRVHELEMGLDEQRFINTQLVDFLNKHGLRLELPAPQEPPRI